MPLPWNRSDAQDSPDSFVDRVPLVRRLLPADSAPAPARSEPTLVDPDDREVDVAGPPDRPRTTGSSGTPSGQDDPGDLGGPVEPESSADEPTLRVEQ